MMIRSVLRDPRALPLLGLLLVNACLVALLVQTNGFLTKSREQTTQALEAFESMRHANDTNAATARSLLELIERYRSICQPALASPPERAQ